MSIFCIDTPLPICEPNHMEADMKMQMDNGIYTVEYDPWSQTISSIVVSNPDPDDIDHDFFNELSPTDRRFYDAMAREEYERIS